MKYIRKKIMMLIERIFFLAILLILHYINDHEATKQYRNYAAIENDDGKRNV